MKLTTSLIFVLAISFSMSSVLGFVGKSEAALHVRASPNTHSSVIGVFGLDSQFEIDCQVNGDTITGHSGTTNVWYHVPSKGGYVSGAYVSHGGHTAPACDSKAHSESHTEAPNGADCSAGLKNPRTCAQAVAWAESHITNVYHSEYKGMCDHFVGLTYGHAASGFASALVHWQTTPSKFRHTDRNPPAGALCFFSIGKYGHATISTGGSNLISTDIAGAGTVARTTISQIEQKWRAQYLGWTAPYFHNA